jgi:protein-S-isoprenylcysteine O-methyltransferase Ste14
VEGPRLYLFTAAQLAVAIVLLRLLITLKTPWNVERYAGTVLVVMGISLVAVARYQLGTSFSLSPEAKQLVTRGLYSKIRNPIYVFGLVTIVGMILVLQMPPLWIVVVIVVIFQTMRARGEARVLEAAFGEEYREYRRKTWF